jgi:hypothetical protein
MADQPRPPAKKVSMKPAMLVGALAVVIVVAFSVGAVLTRTAAPPARLPHGPRTVPGSALRAVAAKPQLSVIEHDGEPPANVLNAIALPAGSARGSWSNPGLGSTFDEEVSFSVDASEAAVLGFYKTELKRLGWRVVSSGAATRQPGSQVVAQIAGDDGFYWQLGVVVSPSTFTGSGTTDVTRFTLQLLQVQDQD